MEPANPIGNFKPQEIGPIQTKTPELSELELKIKSCGEAIKGLNSSVWEKTHGLDLLKGRLICVETSQIKGKEEETLKEFVQVINEISIEDPMLALNILEGFKLTTWATTRLAKINFDELYLNSLNHVVEDLQQVFCRVFIQITADEIDSHPKHVSKPEYPEKCPNFHLLQTLVCSISLKIIKGFLLNPELTDKRKTLMFEGLLKIQLISFQRNFFIVAQTIHSFFINESILRLAQYYNKKIDSVLLENIKPVKTYLEVSGIEAYKPMREKLPSNSLPVVACFLSPLATITFRIEGLEESTKYLRKTQLPQLIEKDLPELFGFFKLKSDCYEVRKLHGYESFNSYKKGVKIDLKRIITEQTIQGASELQNTVMSQKKILINNLFQIIKEVFTLEANSSPSMAEQIFSISKKIKDDTTITKALGTLINSFFHLANSKMTEKTLTKSKDEIIAKLKGQKTEEHWKKEDKKADQIGQKLLYNRNLFRGFIDIATDKGDLSLKKALEGKLQTLKSKSFEKEKTIRDTLSFRELSPVDQQKIDNLEKMSPKELKQTFLQQGIVVDLDLFLTDLLKEIESFCEGFEENVKKNHPNEIVLQSADSFIKDLIKDLKKSLEDQSIQIIQELKNINEDKDNPYHFYSKTQLKLKITREKLDWLEVFDKACRKDVSEEDGLEIDNILGHLQNVLFSKNEIKEANYLTFPEFEIPKKIATSLPFLETVRSKLAQYKDDSMRLEKNKLEIEAIKPKFLKLIEENKQIDVKTNKFIEACFQLVSESEDLREELYIASKEILPPDAATFDQYNQ